LELEELIYLKKYLEISVIIDWFTNDFLSELNVGEQTIPLHRHNRYFVHLIVIQDLFVLHPRVRSNMILFTIT
jgi:hypothetical protein